MGTPYVGATLRLAALQCVGGTLRLGFARGCRLAAGVCHHVSRLSFVGSLLVSGRSRHGASPYSPHVLGIVYHPRFGGVNAFQSNFEKATATRHRTILEMRYSCENTLV